MFEDNNNWVAIVTVLVLWILVISAIIVTNIYSKVDIREIEDKCESNEVKYRYYIKLIFNPKTKKEFNFKRHVITVRIHDSNDVYVTTFTLRMEPLKQIVRTEIKERQEIKVIVNRSQKIENFGYLVFTHSAPNGVIYVNSLTIVGIDTEEHYFTPIETKIKALPPINDQLSQRFKIEPMAGNADMEENQQLKSFNWIEILVFFYMSTNLVIVLSGVLMWLSTTIEVMKDKLILFAFLMILIVEFVQLMVVLVYRFYIKQRLAATFGAHTWNQISLRYLIVCFALGVVCGAGVVIMAVINKFDFSQMVLYSVAIHIVFNLMLLMAYIGYNRKSKTKPKSETLPNIDS